MTGPAQIQDKAPKPAGLLPKNIQSWLLIALALLMVMIMWLTGGKKPSTLTKVMPSTGNSQAPLEINEAKIGELQNRIQELQHEQLVAQSALSQQTRLLGATADQHPDQPSDADTGNPPDHSEDEIQSERKKRAYLSLFASNVALSYRKPGAAPQETQKESPLPSAENLPSGPASAQMPQLLKEIPQGPLPQSLASAGVTPQNQPAQSIQDRKEEDKNSVAATSSANDAAAGKTHVLFEGTILETVLINRLNGQFSGPVECLVSTNAYSNDRQHLLIPAGSKILGEAKKVDTFGQTRLAVLFHRLIMPDGYSISLDQFKGLDQIGDTGLRDQVNNHYFRIFGFSLAIGALGAVAEAGTGGPLTSSGNDLMRQGFAQSTAQSSAQILDKFLNIMPSITIREGHRIKVYLSGDLALPDYNNHIMPSHL
jgi:type IV secretion system protein TrbI